MSSDIARYAHKHTFPNGNVHRHVHRSDGDHPDLFVDAHDPVDCFYCVDCEPWRAQQAAIDQAREAARG